MRRSNKITLIILTFCILGIGGLQIVSHLATPLSISPDQVSAHEGEFVIVNGVTADIYQTQQGETLIKLAGDGTIITIFVETGKCPFRAGDRLSAQGKVERIGDEYQVQVSTSSMLTKKGSVLDKTMPLTGVHQAEGDYIQTGGVISDLFHMETYIKAELLDPLSNFRIDWYVYEPDITATIGAQVNISGFVNRYEGGGIYIQTYTKDAITMEGMWESRELGLKGAFEDIMVNRREYLYFQVNITGYVLFQPNPIFSSFTLSDCTTLGGRTLEVALDESINMSHLERRDLVKVRGRLRDNEKNMELILECSHMEVLEEHGRENITFDELEDAPFLYEYAKTSLSGLLCKSEENISRPDSDLYNHTGFIISNYVLTMELPIVTSDNEQIIAWQLEELTGGEWTGSEVNCTISGVLVYLPERMGYVYVANSICTSPTGNGRKG